MAVFLATILFHLVGIIVRRYGWGSVFMVPEHFLNFNTPFGPLCSTF